MLKPNPTSKNYDDQTMDSTESLQIGLSLIEPYQSAFVRRTKRAIDIVAALCFFTFFGGFYLLIWTGVLLTSGGPAIYSQARYGKDGKIFKFYKFRSMINNSEEVLEAHLKSDPMARLQWDKYQKLDHDPRITKFGSFIRKTSLDELPQFWNVLVGQMSLVGPRPCMPNQRELYGHGWKFYCAVRPGITGLWQVSGRNKLTFSHRVALDIEYVKKLSIMDDLKIMFRTFSVVLTGHGSR